MTALPDQFVKKVAIHLGGDDVDRMLERQNMTALTPHTRRVSGGALGHLGGQALPAEGSFLFFTGVPINGAKTSDFRDADAAARLFPQFDGAFAGFFWDEPQQILVVATDCLGMQPLYMAHIGDELKFVSDTKALPADPDLATWGAFISIGHPIGDRSLVKDLKRVPPASVLTYDCKTRSLTIRRYWDWPASSDAWRRYDFIEALEADMRAYARLGLSTTLLLSGGFDSRLLLFLLKRMGLPTEALVVTHDDEYQDADGRLAEKTAQCASVRYQKVRPPADFFSSADYLGYVAASDMGFPSLDLFIAKVAAHIDSEAVWDGLAPGFVFMPLHQPRGAFSAYLKQEIKERGSPIWRAASCLFKPDVVEAMQQGFAEDLQAETGRAPQDAEGLARFVIENRSRNRAGMNPLKAYANRTAPFTPGLSKDFMNHAVGIPFEQKQHGRFYLDLFAKLDRRALKVPFLSGGQLLAPSSFNVMYYRECLRNELYRYRVRYPSLFSLLGKTGHRGGARRSVFLDNRLLDPDDPFLKPDAFRWLQADGSNNYLAWKLLFHWKAWRWLHQGRLHNRLMR